MRRKLGKLPPLLQDEEQVNQRLSHHRLPKRQEKKVGSSIGGRRQGGSGSYWEQKGDARRDGAGFPLLVECKRSMGKKSIRLELNHLTKITNEALGSGKYPALDLQFDESVVTEVARARRQMPADTDWIAVPLSTFRAMLEALGEEGLGL
jgi:hypothetical protein